MLISYQWLQDYFDEKLPGPEKLTELLTFHAFEVEGIESLPVSGEADHVLDIDVLPNRAHDSLAHRSIAKELSVILNLPMKKDPLREALPELPQSKELSVLIDNMTLCRRFTGAVIKGVKVGSSPEWLSKRLEALGQKSINNIVDAANYVMFDLGQPLHAFDAGKLEKKDNWSIRVRTGKSKEQITTLDGEKYELGEEDLLITDSHRDIPVGIAGVKGGKEAEVTEETTDLIIESANFHPTSVRKTSQKLKLRTDASTRFENELSPDLAIRGLVSVVNLIVEIADGEVEGYVDEYPRPRTHTYKTGVSVSEINQLLGTKMVDKEVEDILGRFGFEYEKVDPTGKVLELTQGLVGKPYKYGASISYDAPEKFDCSSFVSYLFAQGGVSIPRIAIDQYVFGAEIKEGNLRPGDIVFSRNNAPEDHTFTRISDGAEVTHVGARDTTEEFLPGAKVEGGVSHNGIYLGDGKIIHASPSAGVVIEELVGTDKFKKIVGYRRMTEDKERYVVEVPFERMDIRIPEDLIEEIGRIYGYENIKTEVLPKPSKSPAVNKAYFYAEKVRNALVEQGFSELSTYSLRAKGEVELANPLASDKNFLRESLSDGLLEAKFINTVNLPLFGAPESKVKIFEIGAVFKKGGIEFLALAIYISGKKVEGEIRDTWEKLSEELGGSIREPAYGGVSEVRLANVLMGLPDPKKYEPFEKPKEDVNYRPISPYPFVLRDIAAWTPSEVSEDDFVDLIEKAAGNLLVQKGPFDRYVATDGRVSTAVHLVFQSTETTLTDEKVNEVMEKITKKIEDKGWEVR